MQVNAESSASAQRRKGQRVKCSNARSFSARYHRGVSPSSLHCLCLYAFHMLDSFFPVKYSPYVDEEHNQPIFCIFFFLIFLFSFSSFSLNVNFHLNSSIFLFYLTRIVYDKSMYKSVDILFCASQRSYMIQCTKQYKIKKGLIKICIT